MPNIKNSVKKCLFVALSLSFVFTAVYAAAMTAEDKLNKGKMLYEEGKYDDAMDNFIDVFVQGNPDQIAQANEYVNLIHFKRGGVEPPKKVPYDAELEKTRETGHEGKVLFDSRKPEEDLKAEKAVKKEEKKPAAEQAKEPVKEPVKEPIIYTPEGTAAEKPLEKIVAKSNMPSSDAAEVKAMRRESVNAQIAEMTESVLAKLSAYKGVNVYMRGGLIDAIDMESSVIFEDDGITFKKTAKDILEQIYSLMILSGTPSFVLLPPGSYSDNVSIQGVRQTVALNSYLINMGISSAKLNFNMGLTTEEPPAKFSDLEGISIVFDYTTKPNLKLKTQDKDLPPVLSLGLYPFKAITPEKDEGMVVDFSVIQTSDKISDWTLQIVQHAKDGKYYVVRQVSGQGPVYRQIFWNGKKQYFGQILPLGAYTIILRATDTAGREKVVRRKVELLESKKKKEAKAVKAPASAEPQLDYSAKRLWTKPEAIRKSGADKLENEAASSEDFMMEQPAGMPGESYGYDSYQQGGFNNTGSSDTGMGYNTGYNTVNMPGAAAGAAGADLAGYGQMGGNSAGAMSGGMGAADYNSAAAVPNDAANYEY